MRLLRARFTVPRMMVSVATVGFLMWVFVEVFIRAPERKHARALISHHEIRTKGWEIWAQEYFPPGAEHHEEYLQLAAWHRQRIQELSGPRMPALECWWREGADVTKREMDLFRRTGGTGLRPVNYEGFRP
jgi:hypothetical protein